MRVTFDDGVARDLEFLAGQSKGTVFAPLDDPQFFAQVRVDPESRTVAWPNGVDLDPAVLHGDLEPVTDCHFRDVTSAAEVQGPDRSRSTKRDRARTRRP